MKKKTLKKDIIYCFKKSKGRFFSIISLVALGSFALVGLQIVGSDMRKTGENYFKQLNPSDITIIGDLGIDEDNQKVINKISNVASIDYGYLKDVVIKDNVSIRIFSKSKDISKYEIVNGKMPSKNNEIAIASYLNDKYKIGDYIKNKRKRRYLRKQSPKI